MSQLAARTPYSRARLRLSLSEIRQHVDDMTCRNVNPMTIFVVGAMPSRATLRSDSSMQVVAALVIITEMAGRTLHL